MRHSQKIRAEIRLIRIGWEKREWKTGQGQTATKRLNKHSVHSWHHLPVLLAWEQCYQKTVSPFVSSSVWHLYSTLRIVPDCYFIYIFQAIQTIHNECRKTYSIPLNYFTKNLPLIFCLVTFNCYVEACSRTMRGYIIRLYSALILSHFEQYVISKIDMRYFYKICRNVLMKLRSYVIRFCSVVIL